MATLKDISKLTGVSIRTVSRALKNDGYIKEDVRKKVLEAAASLNYTPNRLARSLRTNKSYEVCVLTWSTDELHMQKIAFLERYLRRFGYQVCLMIDSPDSSDQNKNEMIDDIIRRRPAGVITLPAYIDHDTQALQRFIEAEVLCVAIDPRHEHPLRIEIDRQKGVYQAVKCLIEQFNGDLAYFGLLSEGHNEMRLEGYRQAMNEAGYSCQEFHFPSTISDRYKDEVAFVREKYPSTELGFSDMANQYAAGLNAAAQLKKDLPRAALLFSDLMCVGFLHGLQKSGLSVPQDLAIIGFDDRSCASLCTPPLTTIAHPNQEVGEAAAQLLLNAIDNKKDLLEPKILTPNLIKRLST